MMKQRMTSTDAHITFPPCLCLRSAYEFFYAIYLNKIAEKEMIDDGHEC